MPEPQQPKGLKDWGKHLWDGVTAGTTLDPAGYVLLGEACRTADIVERLSGALASGSSEWIRLAEEAEYTAPDAVEIKIVVNPLLGEIRQQRLALRQLLAQLKLGNSEANRSEDDDPIAKMMAEFALPD
ncbi:terminase small subunit [Mycobacterium phage prophiGD54-2]|uniref:hypothetical protein n=1 Tax=Mycobacteroides abscessus TaxID=36809 RepID=UPI0019D17758|nr:hypothetical protein [Mycobacteroides abscessus]QSM04621.1 terminase small subunit [Mycobacterium phage prophiGD54-2]QSN19672.1 hypothetical protein I3U41_17345 [Mycobacteroides abscessus subsp. abscessus]